MGNLFRLGGAPRLTWSKGALWASISLSILFMVVYNACNYITSIRPDVDQLYFQWEHFIPFVPLMIIPYMSIDLFFVVAPFMLDDELELRVFKRRITLTILAAGLCYLLFPLELVTTRPHVEGWLGTIFNPFVEMDKPHNLLPSLHIALRTILADSYARHTRGSWRWASHIWFSLVGLSTLLTHQHHVVDVIGGFMLAAVVFHCVQKQPLGLPVKPNKHVAGYYATGCFLLVALGWWWRPKSVVLLWPACSLGLMALANYRLGPGIFRKQNGRLSWLTWFVLWPVLLGQKLSLHWYAKQCSAWDRIDETVWIGRVLNKYEAQQAIEQGVIAVIDLTGEFSETAAFRTLHYLNLPVLDLTAPSINQIEHAISFIRTHQQQGAVYVHCKIGYSRSAAIAGAWLLANDQASTTEEIISQLRDARPSVVIRPEIRTLFKKLLATHPPINAGNIPNHQLATNPVTESL